MSNSKNKTPKFAVGQAAARQVEKELHKSTNPTKTISDFQLSRSLHSMFSKAFGTLPTYSQRDATSEMESLDTDSVLVFLTHLGVSQYEVHKRISDSLQKELEDEIRKINNQEPLLSLLKTCWHYAATVPELRPILWAVLKQLGDKVPTAVLKALGEDDGHGNLKHSAIFRPLPPLLKRLVWEADWDKKIPMEKEHLDSPSEYMKLLESTLLYGTVDPLIEKYCGNTQLLESASKLFASTAHERRVLTTQRRALASSTSKQANMISSAATLLPRGNNLATCGTMPSADNEFSSGKAVSQLRDLLSDTDSGTSSYREKLLHGILSILIARHGNAKCSLTTVNLHCTLVADILLSAGGSLPAVYQPVATLTRSLDDAVKNGIFSEEDLVKVQGALKTIYEANDGSLRKETGKWKKAGSEKDGKDKAKPTTFLKRQLNRIITAGLTAMKESDPQNLFLNPVSDSIAPGYSRVITKPMCFSSMGNKIEKNAYNSLQDWEADVKLMFKNCVDYNRGVSGKWFRDEAGRQLKIFRDEILPQAKKLYMVEVQKRTVEDEVASKKREIEKPRVSPLEPVNKKRRMDPHDNALSMPTLASVVLSDPFVVRLLLDHVLRSLRIDVLGGNTIPIAHTTIPSVLQLLHIAQWSSNSCQTSEKLYFVPESGLSPSGAAPNDESSVPYYSIRRYLPVLVHLLLEAKLDKRFSHGGDLASVAHPRQRAPGIQPLDGNASYQVVVALFQGVFVHLCLPGNSQETTLALTFEKLSQTLVNLKANMWEEKSFFASLVPTILRHKARLKGSVRDAIISSWMVWLGKNDVHDGQQATNDNGSILSAAHEYFLLLLNSWAKFGNTLISRDLLSQVVPCLIKTVNRTESVPERKFSSLWKSSVENEEFRPLRIQYERILKTTYQPQLGKQDDIAEYISELIELVKLVETIH
eukprot:scaffold1352_cov144-Cylindrotheca_fusiformis.AAC.2